MKKSDDRTTLSRRTALGLLGVGGLGLATGQVAGQDQGGPPHYNWRENVNANGNALQDLGALEMADNPTAIRDFAGENLEIDDGVLNAEVPDGDPAAETGLVHVDDFGAEGDGETDDTDAIRAAVDSLDEDEMGVLVFSAGSEYRLTGTIDVDVSRIRGIEGNNARLILDADIVALDLEGTHTGTANPSSVTTATREDEMNPFIHNLRIGGDEDDPRGTAIAATLTYGLRIHGCQLLDLSNGIRIYGNNRNPIITNNHIWRCTDIGLHLDEGDLHQILVNDNHISYCKTAIRGSGTLHDLHIVGNDIEASSVPDDPVNSIHIADDGAGNIEAVQIVGNTIDEHGNLSDSTVLFRASEQDIVKQVHIVGNKFSNSGHEDIRFVRMTTATVASNTFESSELAAVKLERNNRYVAITGNVVRSTSLKSWDDRGGSMFLHVDGQGEYQEGLTVTNNLADCDANLVKAEDTRMSNVRMLNNNFRKSGGGDGWAIDLDGLTHLRNVIFSNNGVQVAEGESGMRLGADEETLVIVKNNIVWEAPGAAFDLPAEDPDNVVVESNLSG